MGSFGGADCFSNFRTGFGAGAGVVLLKSAASAVRVTPAEEVLANGLGFVGSGGLSFPPEGREGATRLDVLLLV